MKNNITFSMIKPSSVEDNHIGAILKMIEEAGFIIRAAKYTKINKKEAGEFYSIHSDKPFYDKLCSIMSSGPVVALVLEKNNAVEDFRKLVGATNPPDAEEGTIRAVYGKSIDENAVHGSDSDQNAQIESSFFFSKREILNQ